jgi:hypothetical protein
MSAGQTKKQIQTGKTRYLGIDPLDDVIWQVACLRAASAVAQLNVDECNLGSRCDTIVTRHRPARINR